MYWILRILLRTLVLPLALGQVVAGVTADKSGYTLFNPVPRDLLRDLSTDRPDQTESPYTVDAGHWQVEMDLFISTRDRDGDLPARELSVMPFNLKVGLSSNVDLQLMIDPYVRATAEDRAAGTATRASGFGDITTRLKVNFWGNDGGPTAFAVMPFVKWPLAASDVRNGEVEGGLIAMLGCELPAGWTFTIMTEADWLADETGGRDTEWLNSITFARDLTANLGGYVEFVAVFSDASGHRWQGQLDVGFTYALGSDIQLDGGCNFGLTRSAPDYQPFLGFSRRF